MNTTKRYLFGIISSVLLAVGLARAAEQLDPMSQHLPAADAAITGTAPDSSSECIVDLSDR
jgi:hypothetical protein